MTKTQLIELICKMDNNLVAAELEKLTAAELQTMLQDMALRSAAATNAQADAAPAALAAEEKPGLGARALTHLKNGAAFTGKVAAASAVIVAVEKGANKISGGKLEAGIARVFSAAAPAAQATGRMCGGR